MPTALRPGRGQARLLRLPARQREEVHHAHEPEGPLELEGDEVERMARRPVRHARQGRREVRLARQGDEPADRVRGDAREAPVARRGAAPRRRIARGRIPQGHTRLPH